jgi:tRNA nucleotidyltransferase/poly(A) polymerase
MVKNLINDLRSQDWIKILLRKGNVYIVGGCVRDAFMNKSPKDIDIVVTGLGIDDIKELLRHYGKTSIVGQSFSVIKFRPTYHAGEDFDIAVPRVDRKIGTGHKGFEISTEGVTIVDDLKRRDFTVNSIAVNVKTNEILDPFNGRKDLQAKILRATDKNAFVEDALRMVRAIQFTARFRFDIEPNTLQLMKKNANLLKEISGERILEEFQKILHKNGSTKIAFECMHKSDMDKALFGKKFINTDFSDFEGLDEVSFYYILGVLGGVTPSQFYKQRLKGEFVIIKALQTLEAYFGKFIDFAPGMKKSEAETKWNVFQMLRTAPSLKDALVMPETAWKVIKEMKAGKIPMKLGDIPVNGNDIMDKFGVKNEEVGNIMSMMYKDALMNKFDWKNKNETLKYLETL